MSHLGQAEIERVAMVARARAGLHDDELVTAVEIAVRLYGEAALVMTRGGSARFEEPRIFIPHDHLDVNFAVAHEIFHREEYEGRVPQKLTTVESERAANAFAAALLAPPRTMQRAYSLIGERLAPLARVFGISQTSAVLRLAEVQASERAVVTVSGNVLARGKRVEGMIAGDRPGLVKVKLRGGIDEGRVAVRLRGR